MKTNNNYKIIEVLTTLAFWEETPAPVVLRGFVQSIRDLAKVQFLILRDEDTPVTEFFYI